MSFKLKTILLFILTSLIPYLILISYIIYKTEEQIVYEVEKNLNFDLELIIDRIDNKVDEIYKDFLFISKLDNMDDIISSDIDKRISNALVSKKRDINLIGDYFVTDLKGKIVASSDILSIGKELKLYDTKFKIDINSSFNSRKIGEFYLNYEIENIKKYLKTREEKIAYLYDKKLDRYIFKKDDKFKRITKSKELKSLPNLKIFVSIDREFALKEFYSILWAIILAIVSGVILITFVSIYFASKIISPIKYLSDTAIKIANTKDYSKRVFIGSNDEIGKLASAFNEMVSSTHKALKTLELESYHRLQLFIKLIDIFNKITLAKDKNECKNIALDEIKIFSENIDLDTKEYQEFLEYVNKMINLQVEKFELIEETKASSKAKSAFLANMSHELRTPLNAIIGFSQVLALEIDEPKFANNIEISAKYLLDMINDILDMAKVEAQKIEVKKEKIRVNFLMQEIYTITKQMVEAKNLRYIINFDSDIEIISDKKLLKQILINLLSNAIKFTSKGSISLEFEIEKGSFTFIVKDSGIGIKKDDLSNLFKQFVQIENHIQKHYKGTGLGLYLSREFAKLLNADLTIHSDGIGKGTIVKLKLHNIIPKL